MTDEIFDMQAKKEETKEFADKVYLWFLNNIDNWKEMSFHDYQAGYIDFLKIYETVISNECKEEYYDSILESILNYIISSEWKYLKFLINETVIVNRWFTKSLPEYIHIPILFQLLYDLCLIGFYHEKNSHKEKF